MFGWPCEIEHTMYCPGHLLNVNSALLGARAPEIFTVYPDVDSMCWICIYSNIFVIGRYKFYSYYLFLALRHIALLVARNWSLAWVWLVCLMTKTNPFLKVEINIFDIVLFQGFRQSYKNRITDCLKIKSVKGLYW